MTKKHITKKPFIDVSSPVPNPDTEVSENKRTFKPGKMSFYNSSHRAESKSFEKLTDITFRKNMKAIDVKRELFIIEGEDEFITASLRAKMTYIIKKSSVQIREWFFKIGIEEKLPETYDEFKTILIEVITKQDLENCFKFREEKWSNYLIRLKEFSILRNIDEERVLKFIRSLEIPNIMHPIFLSLNCSLESAIDRVIEIEAFKSQKSYKKEFPNEKRDQSQHKHKKSFYTADKNTPKEIKCFKCNLKGHIKPNCPQNKLNNTKEFVPDIDTRRIWVAGKFRSVIFDSGASSSFLCSGNRDVLKGLEIKPSSKKFWAADGREIKILGTVYLLIKYLGVEKKELFFIIENKNSEDIIIGNRCIRYLKQEKKEIPIKCEINTKNANPISWSRAIKNYKDKKDFDILIKKLEDDGITEESNSLWLNPVVLTRKSSGELRFCIDFRKLNDLVDQDGFQIPKINELITTLHMMEFFTVLDLKDGFFQIKLAEKDKEKTAFYTGSRLMQFTRKPQGYKNSPAIFQRCLNFVLKDLINIICVVYIDDILVFGKTVEEHNRNLEIVMDRLITYGLEENEEKRIECVKEVKFLGYIISKNIIKPNLDRAQGIKDFQRPKNKKQLQRFLGMLNYDRIFFKNVTEIIKPLYELLGKERKFSWNDEHEKAMNKIKKEYEKNLELFIPNLDEEFEVETDASDIGIGGVLLQNKKPVAYVSRSLTKPERSYGITDREFLSVVWCLEKFEYYLIGKHFNIYTDHEALKHLKTKTEFGSKRAQRWLEKIERFNFDIIYQKGSENILSDALSRSTEIQDYDSTYPAVEKESREENKLGKLETEEIIKNIHKNKNHRKNIYKDVAEKIKDIKTSEIKQILRKCEICARKNTKRGRTCKFIATSRPGEKVAMDILEIKKNERIILAIDYFSRKIHAKLVTKKEGEKILSFIKEVHKNFPIKTLQNRPILPSRKRENRKSE